MNKTNGTPTATEQAPAAPAAPQANDQGIEKVKRSEINIMFQLLAYAEANTWTLARLSKKIRTIESILEKDPAFIAMRDKLPQPSRDLYEKLKKIVATEDGVLDIVEDRNAPKAAKEAKAPKAAKEAKAPKAGTPPQKKVDRDNFGCSVGSDVSLGMAVLTKDTPLKMKEIVEKGGLKDTIYNYLNSQIEKKVVIKTDKGYALTELGESIKNKPKDIPQADAVAAPAAA